MRYNRVEMTVTAIVVMGVAGAGKTSVGKALARALDCPFFDGDAFHPPENVAKMAVGIPLRDVDRAPWLTRLHDLLAACAGRGERIVLAASLLKRKYRAQLRAGNQGIVFVYLRGDFDLIWQRLARRLRPSGFDGFGAHSRPLWVCL